MPDHYAPQSLYNMLGKTDHIIRFLRLHLNLRDFDVIIYVSKTVYFKSKLFFILQKSINKLESDGILHLSDKILEFLFISYVQSCSGYQLS